LAVGKEDCFEHARPLRHELQRVHHVYGPVEEQADLRRTATRFRANLVETGTMLTASSIGRVMVTCICSIGITPLSTPI